MEELKRIIAEQQKGHEEKPRYMIGLQLLDIAKREPKAVELLKQDLTTVGMSLEDAEKDFEKYADEKHKEAKGSCFVITPNVAEGLLRKFYGLGEASEQPDEKKEESFLDLGNFL